MFCWPCISIYLCNKNQLDALFILILLHQSTSTCFGHIYSSSSGGILFTDNNWCVLYVHSKPPDDGLQICPKHVEFDWCNKMRINSATSWFLLRSPHVVYFRIATYTHNLTEEHACVKVSRNIWLWDAASSLCRMLCLHGMNLMVYAVRLVGCFCNFSVELLQTRPFILPEEYGRMEYRSLIINLRSQKEDWSVARSIGNCRLL